MNISENQGIAGKLIIKKYDLNGALQERVSAGNDITKNGRDLVARLFNADLATWDTVNKVPTVKRVTKVKLGTSDKAFDPAHTSLQGPVKEWETKIVSIDKKDASDSRVMLTIKGELDESQCNGEIKEAGLFTDDDVMYNRVTFGAINKSDQFRFTLIWEITF